MCRDDDISERQKAAQERIFRLAQRDYGLTIKAISLDSKLHHNTISDYANGRSVMSIASLFRLIGIIPDELLSLLLPEGRQIVQAPDDIDHEWLCDKAREYVDAKVKAHREDSPAGPNICPFNERPDPDAKAASLRA